MVEAMPPKGLLFRMFHALCWLCQGTRMEAGVLLCGPAVLVILRMAGRAPLFSAL